MSTTIEEKYGDLNGTMQDVLRRLSNEAFGGDLAWARMEPKDFATQICARLRRRENETSLQLAEWRHSTALASAVRKNEADRARALADRLHIIRTVREVPDSLMSSSIKEAVIKRSGLEYAPSNWW